ncbi:MAG: radical SAM protein [Desulfuromonadales bacterium]|nr:radical SAM protein [Desulfuromonadales bacterium]
MTTVTSMKPQKQDILRPPKTLTIAVTGACNLACRHCWVESGVSSAPGHVAVRTLYRLLEEFAALGGEGVRFTGGEPLCHPEWLELMRFSRSIGFRTLSLQTNGMLFKDEHMAALGELDFSGLSIQISLDGATAAAHDLVRGQGAFAGTLDGILRLVQQGLAQRISLFMTEMRHNLDDIPAILEFAERMGIPSFSSGALVLCGRAAEESAVAPPDTEQYLRLLERYDADPRFRELYRKIGRVAALEWRSGCDPRSEGCTFVENPYLTAAGTLYPCVLCHADSYAVQGVFQKDLAAALAEGAPLWTELARISRERDNRLSACQHCPGRQICAGGCMGRAWGSCGDLLTPDDRCETRRAIYQQDPVSDAKSFLK